MEKVCHTFGTGSPILEKVCHTFGTGSPILEKVCHTFGTILENPRFPRNGQKKVTRTRKLYGSAQNFAAIIWCFHPQSWHFGFLDPFSFFLVLFLKNISPNGGTLAPWGPMGAPWGPMGPPWGPMGSPGPYPMAGPYPCSGYPQATCSRAG